MSALFLDLARTFSSPLPPHVQIEDDLLNCGPCPVVRLAQHKPIVSVDAVLGMEIFATNLACKHITTVLQNFVLARHLQRLESFVTDITGVNPLFLVICPPTLIPSSDKMISLTNLPSTTADLVASR